MARKERSSMTGFDSGFSLGIEGSEVVPVSIAQELFCVDLVNGDLRVGFSDGTVKIIVMEHR